MIELTQSNPWSEALGSMMQKDASRRFLMSLERRNKAIASVPDGSLVDTIRALLEERSKIN
ncbi:MAG: hypothetical protein AAFV45_11960 [Pseudomonadota bacterium]